MSLLQKYLKKLNVNEFSELTEDEKETYRTWEDTLSGKKLTDEDVARFLDNELEETLAKLVNPILKPREDIFLKMKLDLLRKVKQFLNSPEVEKKMLEENIKNLI